MTKRLEVVSTPAPLEAYVKYFDPLFEKSNQREAFRQYLEGLLVPSERPKTLTGLANTEPVVGAQLPRAQKLQWFLSESNWDERKIEAQRLSILREDVTTAPSTDGVVVIDETGDRKDGHKTAHVGRQYLGNLGKIDNGVVSVTSLWADEHVYYPLEVEPYTPESYFPKGKNDPAFRTKLTIGFELVHHAVEQGWPFRAVVADSFYGEDRGLKEALQQLGVPIVMALKPSHAWWHPPGVAGSLQEVAKAAGWESPTAPGKWSSMRRTFRDGTSQQWWVLEIEAGPYGADKAERAVVATTDPATLPDPTTWYLVTTLPAPEASSRSQSRVAPANLEEVIRLYGLRMWVEQSYKQVKHALGWAHFQVRSDRAIRRHWQLVLCAFSFCWYHSSHGSSPPRDEEPEGSQTQALPHHNVLAHAVGTRKKNQPFLPAEAKWDLAASSSSRAGMVGALDGATTLLESVVRTAPTSCVARFA